MQRVEVHKFGGTSVGSAERIEAAARCVDGAAREARVVVVASAMSGVTDELLRVCALATEGRREEALSALAGLAARHEEALGVLGEGAPAAEVAAVRAELQRLLDELGELAAAVSWLRELSPRTRSTVLATGEKLSVRLLALALRKLGHAARALDADGFVETEGRADEAAPVHGVTERTIVAALAPRLGAGELPVVTGFCGRDAAGATTVLGRGGSDYTATLIGAALGVDEVTIWTDVDGVFTADPRVVPEARRIEQLNFREAAELSYYGAKVLHQRTIIPVASRGIPVRIKNSFAPERGGTVVDGRFTPGSHPVKAISAVRGQALVSVEGKGMAGVPGVSARLFTALFESGINVTMISQSSSESSICLAVPASDARAAELALKRAFRGAVSHGDVDDVVVRPNVGLVAAVGLGMAHTPGVAQRIFTALGRHGVNVLAIAQGSSELNISLAVDEADVDACVRALHTGCGLHRFDTGEESPAGFDVLLLGCGSVGRALVELLLARGEHVHERFGLRPRVVAVADRSGFVLAPRGLLPERLRATLAHKAGGGRLAALDGARAGAGATEMVRAALEWRLRRPVLVDVSDEPGAHETYAAALELGCDVVTANKGPLAGPRAVYDELVARAAAGGRVLKAEATVGAGLPVVDTLEMLLATGDRLKSAEGCLSGTLAFLTTRMEEGQPFSEALAEAARLGYTEPDPAVDLGGLDVRRKATILARLAGLAGADANVTTEGLVGDGLAGLPLDELLARLRDEHDGPLAARVARCKDEGRALRYLARVTPEGIAVGPAEVPADGPLGMLRGPDNMVVFRSERYDERPLVVSGPGAGVPVTAMGVLSDVLRVAAEREGVVSARREPEARAFVPATVANLGPGYDVLGLALDGPGDTVVARFRAGAGVTIARIEGDEGRLPREAERNAAGVAATKTLERAGSDAGVELELHKGLPIGSGLGSSAASAAAAAFAVNQLLGAPLRKSELIEPCVEAEAVCAGRHADNVAPALLGGLVLVRSVEPLHVERLPVPDGLTVAVATPAFELETRAARAALPERVALADMVRHSAQLAALVSACWSGDLGLLADSLADPVVTPARIGLVPGGAAVLEAARGAGALGASLSGSGPSIFALCHSRAVAEAAAQAMRAAFADAGLDASTVVSSASCPGARAL